MRSASRAGPRAASRPAPHALVDRDPAHLWNRLSALSPKQLRNAIDPRELRHEESAFVHAVGCIRRQRLETDLVPLYKRYVHDRTLGRADADERLEERLKSLAAQGLEFSRAKDHDSGELRGLIINDLQRPLRPPRTPLSEYVMRHSPLARHLHALKAKPPADTLPVASPPRPECAEAVELREDIRIFETALASKRGNTSAFKGFPRAQLLRGDRCSTAKPLTQPACTLRS